MEYAATGAGGYYYYPPSQPQTLRRPPRPAARWVKQWIPQDLATSSGKCALFKWVREDVHRNFKENNDGLEPEALKPEPTTEILFLCSYENCGKTFVDVAALRKHAHVHGERQYVCQEPGCGKKFVDSSKLKRHYLIHTGQKDFICPHPGCGKAFSLDFNLRAHLKTHALENYHLCPFPACGKRFTSDSKLKSHVKTPMRIARNLLPRAMAFSLLPHAAAPLARLIAQLMVFNTYLQEVPPSYSARLTDAVDEGRVEGASSVRQASGIADEGEEMEALVQRMDLEDQDYLALSEDEGSDDEDAVEQQAVPSEWNTYQFDSNSDEREQSESRPNVCVIHDRHAGLLSAITQLQ